MLKLLQEEYKAYILAGFPYAMLDALRKELDLMKTLILPLITISRPTSIVERIAFKKRKASRYRAVKRRKYWSPQLLFLSPVSTASDKFEKHIKRYGSMHSQTTEQSDDCSTEPKKVAPFASLS